MQRAIRSLVEFSRALSTIESTQRIVELLARGATDHLGATAAAVFAVGESGRAELVASQNLPPLEGLSIEPEAIFSELATTLSAQCGVKRDRICILPLVADSDLVGACVVVLDFAQLQPWQVEVAEAMVDLAAAALRKEQRIQQLSRDHAELKASRERLARSEKLRLLGQMSAGVAHDLRNLFSPLALQLELLKRNRDRLGTIMEPLDRTVKRGLDTVERLRQFGKPASERSPQLSDLNVLVTEASEICAPRIHEAPAMDLRLELATPPRVLIEPSGLVSAVVNLVSNAVEAMPDGGTITIRTGRDPGAWVQVKDTGPGIPAEIQSRLFEPYFTTKGDQGTGLGLATVLAFVERQGGAVAFDSAPGRGTAFTMSFPLAAAAQLSATP